jgi:hypothetical protein
MIAPVVSFRCAQRFGSPNARSSPSRSSGQHPLPQSSPSSIHRLHRPYESVHQGRCSRRPRWAACPRLLRRSGNACRARMVPSVRVPENEHLLFGRLVHRRADTADTVPGLAAPGERHPVGAERGAACNPRPSCSGRSRMRHRSRCAMLPDSQAGESRRPAARPQ